MQEPTDQKRKKIVHDFAKWTALSALRSGSPLKRAENVFDLIENHADLHRAFSGLTEPETAPSGRRTSCVAEVVDVRADGVILVRVLPGPASEHLALLSAERAGS